MQVADFIDLHVPTEFTEAGWLFFGVFLGVFLSGVMEI